MSPHPTPKPAPTSLTKPSCFKPIVDVTEQQAVVPVLTAGMKY